MKISINNLKTIALTILFSALAYPMLAIARPPSVPVNVSANLEEEKGILRNEQLNYKVQFEHRDEAKRLSVEASLIFEDSSQLERKQETFFRQRIDQQGSREMEVPIKLSKPGTYLLEVKVSGEIEGDSGFSNDFHRYILVDEENRYRIIRPKQYVRENRELREKRFQEALKKNPGAPDLRLLNDSTLALPPEVDRRVKLFDVKTQLDVRPTGPSAQEQKYIIQNSDNAWSPEDPITIRGRLVFQDFDNVTKPLVNVSVDIYDEDTGFDEHLGTVGTDWNGNWSFSVNNDDGLFANGRDIYYKFKLENTRIRVQDCDGIDSTYRWQSATHDNRNEGSVLDYGTETGTTNRNAMQVWSSLNLAWNGAVTLGARDPGFVDTCYPEDGGSLWSRFWEEIDINSADNNGPDIIFHEYGHAIMYYAYGSDSPSPGGPHAFGDDAQNASLSWGEGWATGFMLALRPDGRYNWNEGDTGQSIENFSDAGNRDGNRNEGRVAAAINDMIDSSNDDNGGNQNRGRDDADDDNSGNRISLSSLLNDTLWGSWHNDFEEFWASLSGELSGSPLGDANEIMFYNYMDVPAPISCVATKVVALESQSSGKTLEGLRRFRDHALKDFNGGQHLINTYYRNSPELAWILLKDPNLRGDTLKMINHFSNLGFVMTENQQFRKLALSKRPVIDKDMADLIKNVMARINEVSSEGLKNDMRPLKRVLESVAGLDANSLQQKIADVKNKHPKIHKEQLQQSQFNKASREAAQTDEVKAVIKKYIPAFDN